MKKIGKGVVSIGLMVIYCLTCVYQVNAMKYNMTYLYGMGDYISMVNQTNGALNEVSPSYFDIDEKGNLKLNPVDNQLVSKMHEQGIKVVPFFSNHWDREVGRLALKNKGKVVSDIVHAVNQYGLDGVNIDLENLNENDRNDYIEIARLVREKLPKDKSLVISVAANPYELKTGWNASYDYTELAKYADYLMVMAYDEHYEGGEAGPVASIGFVEKSISYACQNVPKEKIVLGIPLYGRYWKEGASYGGDAISMQKMNELVGKYQVQITYDNESQSVKAVVTIKNTDVKPRIYGKEWSEGRYIIWYENESSIKAKLDLVQKYDIKGVGTWRLGMEEKSLWNILKEELQEALEIKMTEFTDVSRNNWAYYAITYLKEKGWIQGKSEGLFAPQENLTRGEMATIVCRMLNLNVNEENTFHRFSDINNHWAKEYIIRISELGIVNGYEDGSFKPDNLITRGEVSKIISKVMELEEFKKQHSREYFEGGNTIFMDLNGREWCAEYVKVLASKNILKGYPDGTFRVNNVITRAEISQVIYNLWQS